MRPKDGRLGALLFNLCDSVTFQVFLDTLAEENPPVAGRRAILVLDNASWHKTKSLNWHHFEPEYLPARSPDLNAIERLWLRTRPRLSVVILLMVSLERLNVPSLNADQFTPLKAVTPWFKESIQNQPRASMRIEWGEKGGLTDSNCSQLPLS